MNARLTGNESTTRNKGDFATVCTKCKVELQQTNIRASIENEKLVNMEKQRAWTENESTSTSCNSFLELKEFVDVVYKDRSLVPLRPISQPASNKYASCEVVCP